MTGQSCYISVTVCASNQLHEAEKVVLFSKQQHGALLESVSRSDCRIYCAARLDETSLDWWILRASSLRRMTPGDLSGCFGP